MSKKDNYEGLPILTFPEQNPQEKEIFKRPQRISRLRRILGLKLFERWERDSIPHTIASEELEEVY